jgi:hypothetical protein
MQDELHGGRTGTRGTVPDGTMTAGTPATPAGGDLAPPPAVAPKVDSVPSDQLWRAAILAARQAAVTAAEIRRAFDASSEAPRP